MRRYLDTSGEIGNSWLNQIMTAEQLVKNSIWLFGAEATCKLIGLATQIIAARYLGDRGYGNYSLAFALSGVFIIFLDTGLSAYLCKQVSCHRTKAVQYLKGVFGLKKLLAFPIVAILICLVILIPGEREIKVVVCAIGLALILNGFTDMYLAVFRAFERMSLVYVLMVAQRALFFLFGFVALLMGYRIVPFAILFLLVSVFSLILAHWNMQRRNQEKEVLTEFEFLKKIMKDCLPVCGIFLFSYVYFRIDVVFIYFMLGEAETGWYNAAFKWLEVLALMVASIRLALLPALSRAYAGQDDQFQGIGREAVRYLLLIGLPLTVGTFTLAPKLVGLLYGDLYVMTVQILQIMSLGFFLICFNEFAIYLLISADRYSEVLKIVFAGAVLNMVTNFLVIPKWGILGAAAVAGFTELFLFYMLFNCMNLISERIPIFSLLWKPVLAAGVMGLVLEQISWPLIPLILVGMGIYFLTLFVFRAFNNQDLLVVRNIFNREG